MDSLKKKCETLREEVILKQSLEQRETELERVREETHD